MRLGLLPCLNGEEWLLFTCHLNPSLPETLLIIEATSTLPLKLETLSRNKLGRLEGFMIRTKQTIAASPHHSPTSWTAGRYLSSLFNHLTLEAALIE